MVVRFRCPRQDCRPDRCPAKQIYSCLTPGQDARLADERLARHFEAGQVVLHHATPALAVLSVHSGRVRLCLQCGRGERAVVAVRGPGELLGVREVLSGMPYQVSAETIEPSVLCAVPREAFLDAVRDCPELAMRLLKRISKDYLLAEEQLVARAQLSVRARTARLLMSLADGAHVPSKAPVPPMVSMGREEMALLVGTTRETLSRSLKHLATRGAVRLGSGGIRVLDPAVLEDLAE